jgi:hypothetical protein
MITPFESQQYCSVLSEQAGEPLIGSAPFTENYLLLEYQDPPGKQALEESLIPNEIKTHLNLQLKALPNARLQLIRGPYQPYGRGPRLYLARTHDSDPQLYLFQLKAYEDLLHLDLQAILNGDPLYSQHLLSEPLYVICTNGKRDPCCSKFGLPVYLELSELLGDVIWQSSHFGGHRFAPNFLILPQGILYGRLGTQTARAVVEAYQHGEMDIHHLRGRVAYPAAVQAAEYHLRQKIGEYRINAFILQESTEIEPGIWQVQFLARDTGERHFLVIQVEKPDAKVYESCQSEKQAVIKRYHWVGPSS